MDGRRTRTPRRIATIASLVAGALAGVALAGMTEAGTAQRAESLPPPWIEATHLPPLLTAADERVELRYDAYCFTEDDVDAPCDVDATVYARHGSAGAFRELPVTEERGTPEGRFVAAVPSSLARSPAGFAYYAVLRDRRTGATVTLPGGGSGAPQRSRPLVRPVEISLGAHRFGVARRASARVVTAPWGSSNGAVGLEHGRNPTPIGGSSFDLGADGSVHVLDEANHRVLRWRRGGVVPEEISVAINGTIADLAVAEDGTMYVLETTAEDGEPAELRAFGARGQESAGARLAERGAQVRVGPGNEVVVLQHPSGQWMRVVGKGLPESRSVQRSTGRAGRPLGDAGELVFLRRADEIRVALADDAARTSWRITSSTELAEVQLAERLGRRVVLVVRVFTDVEDEFRVLVLGEGGLVDAFSVAAADWAETAPLSRFRVHGSSLYQLGSTPAGLFVDRFDLEVD